MDVVEQTSIVDNNLDGPEHAMSFASALIAFGIPLAVIIALVIIEVQIAIALLAGVCAASCVSACLGWSAQDIQKAAFAGINRILGAMLLMVLVGIMIAVWIEAGCVPALLFYGVQIINPGAFLPLTFVLCVMTGITIGTSWGTAGTIGLALMGVSNALGFPPEITAGAIISGALIGEKTSPISGTTILTAASTETSLADHILSMLNTTIPVFIISIAVFSWLGLKTHSGSTEPRDLDVITSGLQQHFRLNPLLLVPPLAVLLLSALRKPAIPVFLLGIALGIIWAIGFQQRTIHQILESAYGGFVSNSGNVRIDRLLSRGGAMSMADNVYISLFAGALAGIVDQQRALHELIYRLLRYTKTVGGLVFTTTVACVMLMISGAGQFCTLTLPGIAFRDAYRERDVHSSVLSRTMEDTGTMTGALIPWDVAALFYSGLLGVSTIHYAPYAIVSMLSPIVSVTMAYLTIGAFRRNQKVRPLTRRAAPPADREQI